MDEPAMRAKEFADRAGVTVRALHLYDELGLLPPAERTESGYRLYGSSELERLEQIVALRFVGFTLQQIKELLAGGVLPLRTALQLQRDILRKRRDRLDCALRAIEHAEHALSGESIRAIIEVLQMESSDLDWAKRYYSESALRTIKERETAMGPEAIQAGERAWKELIAEVEEAKAEDPASDRAQQLARRWKDLIGQFTGGDPEVQQGLKHLWSDPEGPAMGWRTWSDEADRFIRAAMQCESS